MTRLAAPLALMVALLAVALVARGSLDDEPGAGQSAPERTKQKDRSGDGDEQAAEDAEQAGPETYVIESGDSLSTIADRFGTSIGKLQRLNPDLDPAALTTGQEIKLR